MQTTCGFVIPHKYQLISTSVEENEERDVYRHLIEMLRNVWEAAAAEKVRLRVEVELWGDECARQEGRGRTCLGESGLDNFCF